MREKLRIVGWITVLLTIALIGFTRAGDAPTAADPAEYMKAMVEAGKPGPEHAKLEPLVGSWEYTCKAWMDPSQPPMESKGTIERKWILGGRFLEEKTEGTNFDGTAGFESFALIGYDKAQQKYTMTWVCNMGTGTSTGLGECDATGAKCTFQTELFCPVQKKTLHGRDEIRIESDDKVVMESYLIEGGKETKMMELVSVRKK